MTRGYTIWYRCLFCTRVYPKSHQLVEHRKANHAEQWNQRKLAKKLEALKRNGLNEDEKSCEEDNESIKDSEEMELEASSPNGYNENETNSDDTASNSTVAVNDSEAETEYSNDESQNESEDRSDNKSIEDEDCKIVYKNFIKREVMVKLTKCDQDLIRIKKEADLLETDNVDTFEETDNTDTFASLSNVIVPMSACLKQPIIGPGSIRTERIFKLFKCDHCNKQFLHKWGLKLHQEVHLKTSRKKF